MILGRDGAPGVAGLRGPRGPPGVRYLKIIIYILLKTITIIIYNFSLNNLFKEKLAIKQLKLIIFFI